MFVVFSRRYTKQHRRISINLRLNLVPRVIMQMLSVIRYIIGCKFYSGRAFVYLRSSIYNVYICLIYNFSIYQMYFFVNRILCCLVYVNRMQHKSQNTANQELFFSMEAVEFGKRHPRSPSLRACPAISTTKRSKSLP